jgi:hypothetical protein
MTGTYDGLRFVVTIASAAARAALQHGANTLSVCFAARPAGLAG